MKKILICSFMLSALVGCATKVAAPGEVWPEAPAALLAPVPNLKPMPADDKSFSDLLLNINDNYTAYYVLKNKFELWQQWYDEQKRIYKQSNQ